MSRSSIAAGRRWPRASTRDGTVKRRLFRNRRRADEGVLPQSPGRERRRRSRRRHGAARRDRMMMRRVQTLAAGDNAQTAGATGGADGRFGACRRAARNICARCGSTICSVCDLLLLECAPRRRATARRPAVRRHERQREAVIASRTSAASGPRSSVASELTIGCWFSATHPVSRSPIFISSPCSAVHASPATNATFTESDAGSFRKNAQLAFGTTCRTCDQISDATSAAVGRPLTMRARFASARSESGPSATGAAHGQPAPARGRHRRRSRLVIC